MIDMETMLGNDYSSAELYTPVLQGLVTSQTGVTFRAAPNSASATQTIQVLSPSDSIPGRCP